MIPALKKTHNSKEDPSKPNYSHLFSFCKSGLITYTTFAAIPSSKEILEYSEEKFCYVGIPVKTLRWGRNTVSAQLQVASVVQVNPAGVKAMSDLYSADSCFK